MNEGKLDKVVKCTVAFCSIVLFAQILRLHPYFGLMDDHYNLFLMVPKILSEGLYPVTREFLHADIKWGMFRALYPTLVYLLYAPGLEYGPRVFFLLNFFVAAASYFAVAFALAKMLRRDLWRILLVVCAFFYAYDLFQHPSLQEKVMHIFGAPLLWFAYRNSPRLFWRTILVLAFTLLGLAGKSSFFIYVGMAWLAFLFSLSSEARKPAMLALLSVTIMDLACFIALSKISREGSYTAMLYSPAKVPGNLFSTTGFLLLLPSLAGLFLFARKSKFLASPLQVLPTLGVLAYLALFLPWGIGGYIQTLVAPIFAALIVQLAEELIPAPRAPLWILPLALLACAAALYRSESMFQRLHDVGEMAKMGGELKAQGIQEIYMPCFEGAVAMQRYFSLYGGTGIAVKFFAEKDRSALAALTAPDKNTWWIFDQGLCPWPGKVALPAGCAAEYRYQSRFSKGFVLAQLRCQD